MTHEELVQELHNALGSSHLLVDGETK